MKSNPKSAIEAIVERANSDVNGEGYHIKATFPNGDVLNAPHTEVGHNWAAFDELGAEPLVVDLTGAVLEIDWAPGPAYAIGERFANVVSANAPSGP